MIIVKEQDSRDRVDHLVDDIVETYAMSRTDMRFQLETLVLAAEQRGFDKGKADGATITITAKEGK